VVIGLRWKILPVGILYMRMTTCQLRVIGVLYIRGVGALIAMIRLDPVYALLRYLLSWLRCHLLYIPRNVRQVVGPSIFESFTGACILWHNESI